MSAVVIIPARYNSTRFPGKPLAPLKGKPLIQHVYEGCLGAMLPVDVIVATDSETIFEKVLSFGGKAMMTSSGHSSGTDRVAEVASLMDYDIIVNVQGDEPLIRPQMIDDVIELLSDSRAGMGTLVRKIKDPEEIIDPNVVKVVFDKENFALYFSRSPIPYYRDMFEAIGSGLWDMGERKSSLNNITMFKHIGLYSYRRDVLIGLSKMEPTRLEEIERLEQLRALENNIRIKVRETEFDTIGVDTPEDLGKVERWLNSYS
ncbi:MAG: 3-deoxy-manno-octulosonate cytidylyltransferase [Thermodesulfovibrionales bacterium]